MRLGNPRPELTTYAGICLTEFMRLVYLSRSDIQKRFSISDIFSRTVLLAWYHMFGLKDLKLFATDLPKAQWNLLNKQCEETGLCEEHFFTQMQAVLWLACPLTKDCFNLNKIADRLSVELLVATSVTKPEGIELVSPSHRALLFADTVDSAFKADIPIPVCQLLSSVWKARQDLQTAFPSGSKENEAALLLWFLNYGRKELNLSGINLKVMDKDYLLAKSPDVQLDTEIAVSRLAHQIWCSNAQLQAQYDLQSLNDRIAFLSWFKDNGIAEYGLEWLFEGAPFTALLSQTSSIVQLPIRNDTSNNLEHGVNIIGNAQGGFGMSQHAIMIAKAVQSANIACAIVDMNDSTSIENSDALKLGLTVERKCLYSVNIAAFTPAMLPHEFGAVGLSFLEQCHNIYYGSWEYPQYPDDHITVIESFDEVWAPSKFTLNALQKIISKPLHYVPLSITMPNLSSHSRADFKIPDNSFLFISTFDYHSGLMRKNPDGCLKAFMQAFPKGNEQVGLIIKTMNIGKPNTEAFVAWTKLKELAQLDRRIIIIEHQLTRNEIDKLVNLCDVFVSLHRAEGFGLAIAEAMLMGKPVIVTNYSGNTEFTLPFNSCLVDYKLVRPSETIIQKLGIETTWAEPNVSQAALYMQRLFLDQDYATKLGASARQYMQENYSPFVVGQTIKDQLENIFDKNSLLAKV